jgi:hypothetical protein
MMKSPRKLLLAALVMGSLVGAAITIDLAASRNVAAQAPGPGDHWRNYNGHWSYWHEGDKRWYYTDGTHWYYHNGAGWVVYEFDKLFGRGPGFLHGDYKIPGPHARVELPRHDVYHH